MQVKRSLIKSKVNYPPTREYEALSPLLGCNAFNTRSKKQARNKHSLLLTAQPLDPPPCTNNREPSRSWGNRRVGSQAKAANTTSIPPSHPQPPWIEVTLQVLRRDYKTHVGDRLVLVHPWFASPERKEPNLRANVNSTFAPTSWLLTVWSPLRYLGRDWENDWIAIGIYPPLQTMTLDRQTHSLLISN